MVALCVALVAGVLPVAFSGPAGAQSVDARTRSRRARGSGRCDRRGPTRARGPHLDGTDDTTDYFEFSLSEPKLVELALRRLDFDADLFLEDSSGSVLASAETAGTANE